MEAEFEGKCLKCNKNPYVLTTLFFTIKVTEIKISTPYFNSLGENTRTQSRPTKWYFSFFFDEFRRMAFDGEYAKYLYLPIIEVDEFISSLKETYIHISKELWMIFFERIQVSEGELCPCAFQKVKCQMTRCSGLASSALHKKLLTFLLRFKYLCTLPVFTENRFDICAKWYP